MLMRRQGGGDVWVKGGNVMLVRLGLGNGI